MLMRQKVFSILALLLMTVTGAMAQTETLLTTITATGDKQASYSTANVATVSFSYTAGGSSAYLANWGWWGYGWSATVNAAEGYTITKCIFYDDANRTATDSEAPFVVETTEEDKTPRINGTPILAYTSKGIKKIDVYGYVTPTATPFDLTLATGSNAHGTVAFTVGDAAATQALKDDVVTVSVTPADGYTVKGVTAKTSSQVVVPMTNGDNGWTFTMPEENVAVTVTYAKNLQDAWIQSITDQTYTGSAIEPTIEVKDGEATLVLNTDYTVAYSNNVETGTATVTVTGTGNYGGTATANFTIVADKSDLNDDITEAENYYNSIKDTNPAAAATLLEAINAAKAVKDNADATQEQVDAAIAALAGAKTTAEDTVLTETKTALNDAITEAEAYYNSIKDSNPAAAATLLETINAAKAVIDNADATQEQVDAAIAALSTAKTTTGDTVLTETKTALNDAITEAEAYYNSIKDSNPAAAAALLEAINAAKAVKDNADATQEQVDAAIAALAGAKTTTEDTVLTETKTALNDAIAEAEAYYNSIKDSNPAAAATLLEAINAAKAVKDNADATQEQVDAAIAALNTAVETVKTEVAAGIIAVGSDVNDVNCCDMNGRRVSKPTKGMYIVNGKKVFVK
ncbi:MAG: hypothetical protein E7070_04145 [Bacteroidales bacterium]|nr:hypothetical protein [Bacteroidales bacterium]